MESRRLAEIPRGFEDESQNPERKQLRDHIEYLAASSLRGLTQPERTVIEFKFGIGGRRVETQAEIGIRMGVSRERVGQIERFALKKLKRIITQAEGHGL